MKQEILSPAGKKPRSLLPFRYWISLQGGLSGVGLQKSLSWAVGATISVRALVNQLLMEQVALERQPFWECCCKRWQPVCGPP